MQICRKITYNALIPTKCLIVKGISNCYEIIYLIIIYFVISKNLTNLAGSNLQGILLALVQLANFPTILYTRRNIFIQWIYHYLDLTPDYHVLS